MYWFYTPLCLISFNVSFDKSNIEQKITKKRQIFKVQIFWESHKNLKKSPTSFWRHYLSSFKIKWEIFSNFVAFSHYLDFNLDFNLGHTSFQKIKFLLHLFVLQTEMNEITSDLISVILSFILIADIICYSGCILTSEWNHTTFARE